MCAEYNIIAYTLFTGGWLSASCPHGVVYGLKFCLRAESPRDHIDVIMSMASQPPIVINDMPHVVARHGNRRRKGMFSPYEGRLAEPTIQNIEAAKDGRMSVRLDWLEEMQLFSPVSDEQAGRKNNHHDIIPKLCLYDRFHETNTVREAEIVRRVTLSPYLNGLVNTQVAEQLHRSTVHSKVFLNMMSSSTHIIMFRNLVDSRNIVINKENENRLSKLLGGKLLNIKLMWASCNT